MRFFAGKPGAKLTHFSRPSSASGTADSEYLFWTKFFFHDLQHLGVPRVPVARVDDEFPAESGVNLAESTLFLATDMGRFFRKTLISALFTCKPPL